MTNFRLLVAESFDPARGYWIYKQRTSSASILVYAYAWLLCFMTLPASLMFGSREPVDRRSSGYSEKHMRRSRLIDLVTVSFMLTELAMITSVKSLPTWIQQVVLCICVWRVADIACYAQRVMLFDRFIPINLGAAHPVSLIGSKERVILMSFLNYIEIALCFGLFYALTPNGAILTGGKPIESGWDSLYFSFITQLTVGYGDLTPSGSHRWVAATQGLLGTIYLTVIIARYIGTLAAISDISEVTLPADWSGTSE